MRDYNLGKLSVFDLHKLGRAHSCAITFESGNDIGFSSIFTGVDFFPQISVIDSEKIKILRTMTVAPQAVQLLRNMLELNEGPIATIKELLAHVDKEIHVIGDKEKVLPV